MTQPPQSTITLETEFIGSNKAIVMDLPVHTACLHSKAKNGSSHEILPETQKPLEAALETTEKCPTVSPVTPNFDKSVLEIKSEPCIVSPLETPSLEKKEAKSESSSILEAKTDLSPTKLSDNIVIIPHNKKRRIRIILLMSFLLAGGYLYIACGLMGKYILHITSHLTEAGKDLFFKVCVTSYATSAFLMMSSTIGDFFWFFFILSYHFEKAKPYLHTDKWDYITDTSTSILQWFTRVGGLLLFLGLLSEHLIRKGYWLEMVSPDDKHYRVETDYFVFTIGGCLVLKTFMYTCAEYFRRIYNYFSDTDLSSCIIVERRL